MIFFTILIWATAILCGIVLGFANARISVLLFLPTENQLEEVSNCGAIMGGLFTFCCAARFFLVHLNSSFNVGSIAINLLVATTFTLIMPILVCIYRLIDELLQRTKMKIDSRFNRTI